MKNQILNFETAVASPVGDIGARNLELGASQRAIARCVVISPEGDEPRERAVLGELFAAGLERYHVRKPDWTREKLGAWLHRVPREWRPRLVLHSHHELVAELGLGGVHFRDEAFGGAGSPSRPEFGARTSGNGAGVGTQARSKSEPHLFLSRSCHDLATLRTALGRFDAVFFSPVFPSLSKPGHAPRADFPFNALAAVLATRTAEERRTSVLALGGITAATAPRALALGFDGVAALGAIWQAADPVHAFVELQNALAPGRDGRPARPPSVPSRSQSPERTHEPRVPTASSSHA